MSKKVILTGFRANNDLQIGNYFGALSPIATMAHEYADEYDINIFVPDLHSFTTPIQHSLLQQQIMTNLRVFAAAGLPLNHQNIHIYRQSYVSAHSELAWILDCFTGFGELSRMTEFKDKSQRLGKDHIGVGQFNYPVLQAADILLYGAQYIPVGDDQRQHIEFTRSIAERMNSRFGELFTVPDSMEKQAKFFGKSKALRIMDLADPTKKMSKSDESGKGVIFLGDQPNEARKKIMGATTDSHGEIVYDPINRPGIANLIDILALLQQVTPEQVYKKYKGQKMYGPLKTELADTIEAFLTDFQTRLSQVDETILMKKIEDSETKMREIANKTLLRVQKAVGLRP